MNDAIAYIRLVLLMDGNTNASSDNHSILFSLIPRFFFYKPFITSCVKSYQEILCQKSFVNFSMATMGNIVLIFDIF